ncbi:recombination protein RecR [Pseudoramibacter alactolyticus ATCC 23263]|uniref:Recombination protein RecR n=1 Tax=Pseudoramibacter alactolyticus ATCC 23263 TaxID=887929 RepID=E6MJ14_9FIRM|nr:recombination mediator RecR [Pseudoramibacter alactolyticus]EFV00834.1 recombination protein RecR [Pseudoramibacter alactolyticus ATCC 23263]MBM6968402.1 recombination protein RecR [Pseudoramibacter alactolyticus]
MGLYPKAVERLVAELSKLPGIGEKTAQRLAFHLIDAPKEDIAGLSRALLDVKEKIKLCPVCFSITDGDRCDICADASRDRSVLCVVENTRDIYAIERTREYHGLYHVLHGVISPLEGIGPQDIKARELMLRLADGTVTEVIMATNPTPEGEATAVYLGNLITPMGVTVTRLAKGIPIGADVEFTDEVTLIKAFEGRKQIK